MEYFASFGTPFTNLYIIGLVVLYKTIFRVLIPALAIGWLLAGAQAHAALGLDVFSSSSSYSLELTGTDDASRKNLETKLHERLKENLKHNSDLKSMIANRRAREETALIEKVLSSLGYYSSSVSFRITNTQNGKSEAKIKYIIETGPLYRVKSIGFNFPDHVEPPSSLHLKKDDPLEAQTVLSTKDQIENYVNDEYCLYKIKLDYKVTLFESDSSAEITFSLQPSPLAEFGRIHFTGHTSIDPEYLARQVAFSEGDCFKRKSVDLARLTLLQTNLLVRVDYTFKLQDVENQNQTKAVDVTFALSERHHRTIKSGGNYSTDGGPGLLLGWEHRNLRGSAEKLEIEARVNDISRFATGRYKIPRFLVDKQSLTLRSHLERENTSAYKSTNIEASSIVSRELGTHTNGELGVALTYADVTEAEQSETYNLISFPSWLTYDYRNSLLNATRGWMASTSLTPFADVSKPDTRFLRWTATSSIYASKFDLALQPTIALRVSTGSITGAALSDVPADQRFYVGGGGSVRGYAYQSIGELSNGEPDGGKSFSEISAEVRTRFADNWGLVLFLDGGYAYATEAPAFGHNFLWGAGLGLRYHTSFAPIRADFGFPLDKRKDEDGQVIDSNYQLYISIGQAF